MRLTKAQEGQEPDEFAGDGLEILEPLIKSVVSSLVGEHDRAGIMAIGGALMVLAAFHSDSLAAEVERAEQFTPERRAKARRLLECLAQAAGGDPVEALFLLGYIASMLAEEAYH